MSKEVVTIGIVKLGCVGTSPLLEFLLDERADRGDIKVRVSGCGAKMTEDEAADAAKVIAELKPDFAIVVSPNAALPGPKKARDALIEAGIPVIVISDGPAKKAVEELEAKGAGYIIVPADSMIGARREFLDPVEMAAFNSDVIRVLALTGVYNVIYESIDKVIESIKKGEKPELPRIILNAEKATEAAGFSNPYARAKAMAAFEMAASVAKLTTAACFKIKEWERYTMVAAAAHEIMRYAAKLADEAREIEKYGDTVTRRPHSRKGEVLKKRRLIEKPSRG